MTDTVKIRLINAYANLIEKYGQNIKTLDSHNDSFDTDKLSIQKAITHLSNEIINISFNEENNDD